MDVRYFALAYGIVFLLVGIAGFVPAFVAPPDVGRFAGQIKGQIDLDDPHIGQAVQFFCLTDAVLILVAPDAEFGAGRRRCTS